MRAHPGYPPDLALQVGLVPIGTDPQSGLWELWHVLSGAEPRRGDDGRLALTEESGLVLVLVPGGRFWMGAQRRDPAGRNWDPDAERDEGPVREVELEPFLLAKHEMTQAQWLRVAGENPSTYPAGRPGVASLLHPVETVTWHECSELLARLGLVLPTEAQWEYAARAGTSTPWTSGVEASSLRGVANVSDRFLEMFNHTPSLYEPWIDGWAVHAPVASFAPNAFGLHHVHGNVFEWCRDAYSSDALELDRGDGLRRVPGPTPERVSRGGGWFATAWFARSSYRRQYDAESHLPFLGVRPAAALVR
jgi:formylglycine-generating enzyme required for sulfatase activity